jgi:hypothetical protein
LNHPHDIDRSRIEPEASDPPHEKGRACYDVRKAETGQV